MKRFVIAQYYKTWMKTASSWVVAGGASVALHGPRNKFVFVHGHPWLKQKLHVCFLHGHAALPLHEIGCFHYEYIVSLQLAIISLRQPQVAYSCQVRHDPTNGNFKLKTPTIIFTCRLCPLRYAFLPRISSAFAAGVLEVISTGCSAFTWHNSIPLLCTLESTKWDPKASHWFVHALVQHETFCHCPVLQNLNENRLVLSGSWCFSCLAWAEKQICLCPWPSMAQTKAPCLFSAWTCCFATAWNRLLSLRVLSHCNLPSSHSRSRR